MEVYLDNSATTMSYPEVGELVYKVMCRDYGNPSSMHRKGVEAEHYIREAKETIARILKVSAKEIFFHFRRNGERQSGTDRMRESEQKSGKSSDNNIHRASCNPQYDALSGRRGGIQSNLSSG